LALRKSHADSPLFMRVSDVIHGKTIRKICAVTDIAAANDDPLYLDALIVKPIPLPPILR
jgi:hypothetical protein